MPWALRWRIAVKQTLDPGKGSLLFIKNLDCRHGIGHCAAVGGSVRDEWLRP